MDFFIGLSFQNLNYKNTFLIDIKHYQNDQNVIIDTPILQGLDG